MIQANHVPQHVQPILMVDDSPDFRVLVADFLRSHGFQVDEVCDGAEAFDYLLSHPKPRAILLDLQMPRMNGISFREVQIADSRFNCIPVVLFSSDPDLERIAERLNVTGYVSKCASIACLLSEIVRCTNCDQRALSNEAEIAL